MVEGLLFLPAFEKSDDRVACFSLRLDGVVADAVADTAADTAFEVDGRVTLPPVFIAKCAFMGGLIRVWLC